MRLAGTNAFTAPPSKPPRSSPEINLTDREILIWIHQRLVKVHKESEIMDYMHALRSVIHGMPPDKQSRGPVCDMHSMNVLEEIRRSDTDYQRAIQ